MSWSKQPRNCFRKWFSSAFIARCSNEYTRVVLVGLFNGLLSGDLTSGPLLFFFVTCVWSLCHAFCCFVNSTGWIIFLSGNGLRRPFKNYKCGQYLELLLDDDACRESRTGSVEPEAESVTDSENQNKTGYTHWYILHTSSFSYHSITLSVTGRFTFICFGWSLLRLGESLPQEIDHWQVFGKK